MIAHQNPFTKQTTPNTHSKHQIYLRSCGQRQHTIINMPSPAIRCVKENCTNWAVSGSRYCAARKSRLRRTLGLPANRGSISYRQVDSLRVSTYILSARRMISILDMVVCGGGKAFGAFFVLRATCSAMYPALQLSPLISLNIYSSSSRVLS